MKLLTLIKMTPWEKYLHEDIYEIDWLRHDVQQGWFQHASVSVLPCWERCSVGGAGAVRPLPPAGGRGLPRHARAEAHGAGPQRLAARPHAGGPPHPGPAPPVLRLVEAHVGAVPAAGVGALGRGPSVVGVVAVVHAGPHIHAQTSLRLLLDLNECPL